MLTLSRAWEALHMQVPATGKEEQVYICNRTAGVFPDNKAEVEPPGNQYWI